MSQQEHIVIVDDEVDVRETLREYLSLKGYKVTALADGVALRQLVERGDAFDLALLDITMPGEDGLSLARYLRASTAARIIMVTASGETLDRIIGLEMGADDYLPKPVDLRELLARVKAVLRRRGESAEGASPPCWPSGSAGSTQTLGSSTTRMARRSSSRPWNSPCSRPLPTTPTGC